MSLIPLNPLLSGGQPPAQPHLFRVSSFYRLDLDGEVTLGNRLEGRVRSEIGTSQQSYQVILGMGDERDLSDDAIIFGERVLWPKIAEIFSRFAPVASNHFAFRVLEFMGQGINLEFQSIVRAGGGETTEELGTYLRILDLGGTVLVGARRGQAHPRWPQLSQVRNAHGVLEENLAEEFPVLAERFFDEVESALVQLDQERAVSPKVA